MAGATGLDPKAVQAANKAFWAKHPKTPDSVFWKEHPDGMLTMAPGDSTMRAEWMRLYKMEAAKTCATSHPIGSSAACAAAPVKAATDPVDDAIKVVEESAFAKTEEGKKVVAKIRDLRTKGLINIKSLGSSTRGNWDGNRINVSDAYKDNPDAIASELVHEATHAVNEDELPASRTKATIDEEMRTNKNQLELYNAQRATGFRDPELERRRKASKNGKLREDVRSRYPSLPENL
jgi:hypothetical protein